MKKMVTATIATLSLGAIGVAQGEAQASENNQSNAQYTSNQSYNDIFNYGYIDQDDNGNYHHTLDGNWDQSMFDQQQYYFYLIDNEGQYHYYYFPMNDQGSNVTNTNDVNVSDDNNYTGNQSHSEVQSEGYDINEAPENNEIANDERTNQTAQATQNNSNDSVDNTQNHTSADNYESSYTQNNGHNDVKQSATSSNDVTPQQQAAPQQQEQAAPQQNTSQQQDSSQQSTTNAPQQNTTSQSTTSNSTSNNETHSANWLTKHRQLQPYGSYHGGGAHYGVDYAMSENTPVYSLADGTVIQSGWSNYGGGNQVTIQEKNSDNYQWYMHMNSLNVQKGQQVKEGQQIGLSGSTGNSTAPHLHFQRMQGGVGNEYSVDPTSYVNSKS
ncbi:M23 family metallopeptidase [Staphylococcus nepalensis]|uniref:M23 family metallopeptidase n=1 Tax=Staphylococcus nepalensis TaxID=214473 RepID=UPI001A98590F|nr:M23 family metallopeptidase [Staphylococcus nepalensis]MBO1205335.1 M23 family metallopeptidase [Staphylococcus nepalensis]